MINPRFQAAVGLAALLVMALGCGTSNKPAAGGGGVSTKSSDPALNKSMTVEEIAALQPPKGDANQEEGLGADISFIVGILSENPLISDPAKRDMKDRRIMITGTVLEKSPDNAETPFLVLDGGEHRGKKYTAKCYFATAEAESLQKLNPQDNVRVEGVTDANVKDLLVEFKECLLKPAKTPADGGTDAKQTSEEKAPPTKP